MNKEPIPAIKCRTIHGIIISVLGAAIPLINAELLRWPPSATVRLISLTITVVGGIIVTLERRKDNPPIKGILHSKKDCKDE